MGEGEKNPEYELEFDSRKDDKVTFRILPKKKRKAYRGKSEFSRARRKRRLLEKNLGRKASSKKADPHVLFPDLSGDPDFQGWIKEKGKDDIKVWINAKSKFLEDMKDQAIGRVTRGDFVNDVVSQTVKSSTFQKTKPKYKKFDSSKDSQIASLQKAIDNQVQMIQDAMYDPKSWYDLAMSYYDNEQYDDAIVGLNKVLEMTGINSVSLYNLACCHAKLGREIKAAECLIQASLTQPKASSQKPEKSHLYYAYNDPDLKPIMQILRYTMMALEVHEIRNELEKEFIDDDGHVDLYKVNESPDVEVKTNLSSGGYFDLTRDHYVDLIAEMGQPKFKNIVEMAFWRCGLVKWDPEKRVEDMATITDDGKLFLKLMRAAMNQKTVEMR